MRPGALPQVDLIGDAPFAAFENGVSSLLAAATPDAVTRTHSTPLGDLPGPLLTGFAALDVLVHGSDLAKASGQTTVLDPNLATDLYSFAQQTISDAAGTRAPRIGPQVAVAEDASPTDRLVAFLGRQP
jgi:uncharacterized protein (TIGR03086 family)